jgi:ribosome-binding factor A
MTSRKPSRNPMRSLCAQVDPEDGVDPRELARRNRASETGRRKAWQLCSQVARTLGDVLAGQCDDDLLWGLDVVSVEPAPDSSRLLVTVALPPSSDPVDPVDVVAHLRRASGLLRCEMAAAITRRKAPVLVFRLVEAPAAGGSPF